MRRKKRFRAGFTMVEMLVGLLLVLVVGLGYWTWTLSSKLNEVDATAKAAWANGDTLTTWIGTADGNDENFTGGLTSYLIELKKTLNKHMGEKVAPNGPAHSGAQHQHADPPPPPPW